MNNKLIFSITLSISAFLIQITAIPYLSVNHIKPDLVAVAIIYVSLILGSFQSMIIAFVLGIIVDTLGGFPLGTSSLVYIWSAYLISYFRNYEFWLGFNFSVIAILGILIIRSSITFIYLLGSHLSLLDLFIVSVIPETIYSAAFAGIFFVFVKDKIHKFYVD